MTAMNTQTRVYIDPINAPGVLIARCGGDTTRQVFIHENGRTLIERSQRVPFSSVSHLKPYNGDRKIDMKAYTDRVVGLYKTEVQIIDSSE